MKLTLDLIAGAGQDRIRRSVMNLTGMHWPPLPAHQIEIEQLAQPKRPRRVSQRKLARLAKKEGVEIKLAPDGTITMTPIKPVDVTLIDDDAATVNEWDTVQ